MGVTFRDEDGKVWPWPLAEIPLTLELQALSGQTVSREEEARPAMAAAGEDHTLVWAALLCVLLLLWVGSPAASHLVGRMEIATDETASEHISTGEEKENGSV